MNERKTIGQLMKQQRREAIRAAAIFMAFVLYGAVLIYTGVHNFNLISRTVAADQQLFAITALLCLEGAAVFLPMAIHFWFAPGPQRLAGYVLYAVEFTVVIMNSVLDSIPNHAASMPDWLNMYATFILPATPIVIGVGIAFVFLLDPSKKVHDAEMAANAASVDAMALHMIEYADSEEVQDVVRDEAEMRTRAVVGKRLNAHKLPALEKPAEATALAKDTPRVGTIVTRDGHGRDRDWTAALAGLTSNDRRELFEHLTRLQQGTGTEDPKA